MKYFNLVMWQSRINQARPMESQNYISFEEIKRNTDKAFSYIVIEDIRQTVDEDPFSRIEKALSDLSKQALNRQIYRDQKTGRKMLIVKMEHQDTEEIMLEFLKTGLKKDFKCYVYWLECRKS